MPESLITKKLRYLHSLWQDSNTTAPDGLSPDNEVLKAYKKASEDGNSIEATTQLALIRDALLNDEARKS